MDASYPPMKADEGRTLVMMSALLHLLHAHEAPRVEIAARKAAKFVGLSSSEMPEQSPAAGLREMTQDDLETTPVTRPLISENAPLVSACFSHELSNYIKTVDWLTKAPDDHTLDVFE